MRSRPIVNEAWRLVGILLLGLVVSPPECRGQFSISDGRTSGIQATGTAQVPLRPERARLRIELIVRGSSVPDALARLKALRGRDEQILAALKPLPDSVRFGDPGIVKNDPEPGEDGPAEGAKPGPPEPAGGAEADPPRPRKVAASLSLVADWKLKSVESADLAIEIASLQQRIDQADLSKIAPEDDLDELQETEEGLDNAGQFNGPRFGQPRFLFAGRLTPQDQQACAIRAFGQAKQQAELLALAAGLKLGPVRSLRVPHAFEENFYEAYLTDTSRTAYLLREETLRQTNTDDVWGKDWRVLEFRVRIAATFDTAAP